MTAISTSAGPLVGRVQHAYPSLAIASAHLRVNEGQFNDILVVNDQLIFRFPRTQVAAETLANEAALLVRLQGRLPLPIPNPIYQIPDPATGTLGGIGYQMLSGEPLWNEALAAAPGPAALDRIAGQLGAFLRALHSTPIAEVAADLPQRDEASYWAELHSQFQAQLYPLMRPDARQAVDALFADLLAELQRRPPVLTLRHGDFGGSNILHDPQTYSVTGVIDFGFAGVGDPAADIASLSCFGEEFLARGYAAYPAMQQMLPRARLYRGTFALQQALYGLQDGNQADFDDGIRDYV
jgi:aminoglycoside 2''-phosphotransferase